MYIFTSGSLMFFYFCVSVSPKDFCEFWKPDKVNVSKASVCREEEKNPW